MKIEESGDRNGGRRMTPAGRILHIAESGFGADDAIGRGLRAAGAEVAECADVYRGLAMLARAGVGAFSAVVVCADDLSADGLAFFRLATRFVDEGRFWTYTAGGTRTRFREAVACGARGVTGTVEAAAGIVDEVGPPPFASQRMGHPQRTGHPRIVDEAGDEETHGLQPVGFAGGNGKGVGESVGRPSFASRLNPSLELSVPHPETGWGTGALLTREEVEMLFGADGIG